MKKEIFFWKKNIKKIKKWSHEQKMRKNEKKKNKQEKKTKNGRKKEEKKGKEGPKGLPPEMGPKIDFSPENCQEKA